MGAWETYEKSFARMKSNGYSDPGSALDAFVKDSSELLEQFDWTMRRLDMEKPKARAYHDWMVARNELGSHIDKIRETYRILNAAPSEETAKAFSDAMVEAYPSLSKAKAIFWWNDFQKEHNGK